MKKSFLGGQAVLEGVLLIFEGSYAVAVKTPNGVVVKKDTSKLLQTKLLSIPFLRGPIALLLMALIGYKAMMFASQKSSEEDEELSFLTLIIILVVTLALAAFLFGFMPLLIATLTIPVTQPVLFNFVDGVIRIVAVVAYILLISRLSEIKRLFAYHGAEHKVINAFESGKATLARARKQSRFNARCGTTFVVLVLFVAIIVYSLTPLDLPLIPLLLLRLAFLIPIASLSYELVRFSYTKKNNWFIRILLAPGYLVQQLTVREPSDEQLEVALAALRVLTKR